MDMDKQNQSEIQVNVFGTKEKKPKKWLIWGFSIIIFLAILLFAAKLYKDKTAETVLPAPDIPASAEEMKDVFAPLEKLNLSDSVQKIKIAEKDLPKSISFLIPQNAQEPKIMAKMVFTDKKEGFVMAYMYPAGLFDAYTFYTNVLRGAGWDIVTGLRADHLGVIETDNKLFRAKIEIQQDDLNIDISAVSILINNK